MKISNLIFPMPMSIHKASLPRMTTRSHNLNSKVGFNILKDIHIDFTAKFTNSTSPIRQLPVTYGIRWPVFISSLEEKTGMAIKRTSRYMIPQEAAMSKTGQIHNNSNSVIHIGCWTDRPLSPTVTAMNSAEASNGTLLRIWISKDVCVTKEEKNTGYTMLTHPA